MKALDALETSLFRDRHPDLVQEIHSVDNGAASDLSFPNSGRAVLDDVTGGYVLVWRDATAHWHYIDVSDNAELAAEVNKPPYLSPDPGFLQNALDAAYNAAGSVGQILSWLPWVIGGLLLLDTFNAFARPNPPRRRARYVENPGPVEIGRRVEKVFYRKRAGHGDCDAACSANGHRFVHTFEKTFPLIGRSNGKLEI